MKLKQVLFIIPLLLISLMLSGCNGCSSSSVGCAIESGIVTAASNAIASGLQCTNLSAIQTDVKSAADSLKLCVAPTPPPPAGSPAKQKLDPVICGALGDLLVTTAASAIPAKWGCSPTVVTTGLKGLVVAACTAIPGP